VAADVEFPSQSDIQKLVQQADGLFIYARTAVEYIRDPDSSPDVQLTSLVQAEDGRIIVEQDGLLDELYTHILANALRITANQSIVNYPLRDFLATLVLVQEPLALEPLTALSGTKEHECARFLRRITAVLDYTHGTSQPVRLMHLSFSDFLVHRTQDGKLSGYGVHPAQDHLWLTERCLRMLNAELIYAIYGTQKPSLLDINALSMMSQQLPESLRYSCRFWAVHCVAHIHAAGAKCRAPQGLDEFCNGHQLLLWINVYNALDGSYAVQQTMSELIASLSVGVSRLG
jgi:hypothetical protein